MRPKRKKPNPANKGPAAPAERPPTGRPAQGLQLSGHLWGPNNETDKIPAGYQPETPPRSTKDRRVGGREPGCLDAYKMTQISLAQQAA
ncbi:hypothetical protein CEK25_002414 [Fusarium fujikuroi]|nr:hypothetical protein CEK25_002414 [Fusarium fujikuroi]